MPPYEFRRQRYGRRHAMPPLRCRHATFCHAALPDADFSMRRCRYFAIDAAAAYAMLFIISPAIRDAVTPCCYAAALLRSAAA